MSETFHSEQYRGFTIELHYDHELTNNPRDWDNLGNMVAFHRDYILGDEDNEFKRGTYDSIRSLQEAIEEEYPGSIFLPLALYDHSGITMFVGGSGDYPFDGAGWDTSNVGLIYCTPDEIRANWPSIAADAEIPLHVIGEAYECMRGEVKTYDQYLTGDMCGYVVKLGDLWLDSCWGFFDTSDPYPLIEARSFVNGHIVHTLDELDDVRDVKKGIELAQQLPPKDEYSHWTVDTFGRTWDVSQDERCFVCGQPDNCGDCDHTMLSDEDVVRMNTPVTA